MICKACPAHPTRTPSPDGTHTCPSCGSSVYLRDAGYERFTEMPLDMKVRDMTAVVAVVVAEVRLLPRPTKQVRRQPPLEAVACSDTRTGPGCGASFVPSRPNNERCASCRYVRWPRWKLDLIAVADAEAWREIAARLDREWVRKPPAADHAFRSSVYIEASA